MTSLSRSARLALGLVIAIAVILALIGAADRPLARALHGLPQASTFSMLTHLVDPLVPIAAVGVLIASLAVLGGCQPGIRMRALLSIAFAVLIAALVKDQLKFAFGRTWPETWTAGNPSYIHDGVFAFVPFHGGKGWMSFPSGHMSVSVAAVAAAWSSFPRLRWLGIVYVVTIAIGLLGADYHWLSDIAAGTLLGSILGCGIASICRRQA